MPIGDTAITVAGNLVEDPQLRFTAVPREFVISEGAVRLNWRVGSAV